MTRHDQCGDEWTADGAGGACYKDSHGEFSSWFAAASSSASAPDAFFGFVETSPLRKNPPNRATRESRDSQIVAIRAAAEPAVLADNAVANAKKARCGRAFFADVSADRSF
jgi:hypothetical protein